MRVLTLVSDYPDRSCSTAAATERLVRFSCCSLLDAKSSMIPLGPPQGERPDTLDGWQCDDQRTIGRRNRVSLVFNHDIYHFSHPPLIMYSDSCRLVRGTVTVSFLSKLIFPLQADVVTTVKDARSLRRPCRTPPPLALALAPIFRSFPRKHLVFKFFLSCTNVSAIAQALFLCHVRFRVRTMASSSRSSPH